MSLVNYDLSYLIACIPTCFKKSEDRSENALTSSILVDKMTHKSLFSRELKEEDDDDVMTEISSEDYQLIKSLGKLSVVKNNDTDLFLRDENSETTPKETKESNISLQMNLVLQQEKEKKELGKVLRKQPSIVQNKSDNTQNPLRLLLAAHPRWNSPSKNSIVPNQLFFLHAFSRLKIPIFSILFSHRMDYGCQSSSHSIASRH